MMADHCGKNRFLAVFIATVMAVTLMPSALLAEAVPSAVCAIGAVQYDSLSAAVAAAVSAGGSQTISLLKDVTEKTNIEFGGMNIVFALNGFNLTVSA